MIFGSLLALFKFWMLEKGVQLGLPIRRMGFSLPRVSSAVLRCDGTLKSHGCSVSDVCV